MIGIDRETGEMLDGWRQLVSRIMQVLTTPLGSRAKCREFGSRVHETLGHVMTDRQLVLAQAFALQAFYKPINGVGDFEPLRCVASRREDGMYLQIEGVWRGESRSVGVLI